MSCLVPVCNDRLERFWAPDGRLLQEVFADTLRHPVVLHSHSRHHHPLRSEWIFILVTVLLTTGFGVPFRIHSSWCIWTIETNFNSHRQKSSNFIFMVFSWKERKFFYDLKRLKKSSPPPQPQDSDPNLLKIWICLAWNESGSATVVRM